ncbi:MAG: hypothetical protein IKI75_07835 [Lachnospiraceae bacterium]|nr:hypothetical protein [Lachnospiraceae bacterium]
MRIDKENVDAQVDKLGRISGMCDDLMGKLEWDYGGWKGDAGKSAEDMCQRMRNKVLALKITAYNLEEDIKKVADEIVRTDAELAGKTAGDLARAVAVIAKLG